MTLLKKACDTYPSYGFYTYPSLGEAYYYNRQLSESERAYRRAFAGRAERKDTKKILDYFTNPMAYTYYALVEIRLQNWQEADLAYKTARKQLRDTDSENMPVFRNQFQKEEREAAVRMILLKYTF